MIKTGGGAFDPSIRHIMFHAGNPQNAHRQYHLTAVNEASTDSERRESIDEPLARGALLFLDSGIFNLTNQHVRATPGMSMDEALALPPEQISGFDELYERYVHLVQTYEHRLWGYIELDQGGRENKKRTRARLEAAGLRPIPVYHPLNDGWDYFDELAENYDRICFGNVVKARPALRVRLLNTMWERRRKYPHLWIHVLGMTASEAVISTPPDSCDSSSWSSGLRWTATRIAHSCLSSMFAGMPPTFRYRRSSEGLGRWEDSAAFYSALADERSTVWYEIVDDYRRVGIEPWPEPHDKETPPCPARQS